MNHIQILHEQALEAAKNYRKFESQLLVLLQNLDQHKVHYKMGYRSLFHYFTEALKLSESVSYMLINVSRKAKEVPELKHEIEKGSITLSKAKKITFVLNPDNKDEWLALAKNSTQAKIEKEVAKVAVKEISYPKLEYVNESFEVAEKVVVKKRDHARIQLQVGISEELMIRIRRAQDILSQKRQSTAGLESLLEEAISLCLDKFDPVKIAEKRMSRKTIQEESVPLRKVQKISQSPRMTSMKSRGNARVAIPAEVKHQIYLKTNGRCTYVDSVGHRCPETRFLDIHHLQSVAKGGGNELQNLTLLCKGHHKVIHQVGS